MMCRTVKPFRVVLSAFFLIGLPTGAFGFGYEAHRIVGHVADRYTCTGTRKALEQLTPGENLSEMGLWADRIRGDKSWARSRPWHYMNVPDDTRVANRKPNDGDVLWAIERFRAELKKRELPVLQRANALRFLVHLVADIHQPLHVGRYRDRGGNTIEVRIGRKKTNLHAYWDSDALEQDIDSPHAYAARLVNRSRPVESGWRAAELVDWAVESKAYRDEVYAYPRNPESGIAEPDAAYQARALEIIGLRLYQAGVRLAGELNGIFCGGKPESSR